VTGTTDDDDEGEDDVCDADEAKGEGDGDASEIKEFCLNSGVAEIGEPHVRLRPDECMEVSPSFDETEACWDFEGVP
jgi:hypothetical protein